MIEPGKVHSEIQNGIGTVTFFHPKKNSLPGALLREMAAKVTELGRNDEARVIVLRSEGEGPFCAGASFDELLAIENPAQGKEFFMGFARLILAMKNAPKFVITRVQGKAVGGGVGVISASDYSIAVLGAAVKLSELALGIGPFVVGPAVERRIGSAAFTAMSIDTNWREGEWAYEHGLYNEVYDDLSSLDAGVDRFARKLAGYSPAAMAELKKIFWEGAENWEQLLEERAEQSGKLILGSFARKYIESFRKK